MTSVSVTEARKRLYALIDEVGQSHEPVQINGKRSNAVLLSEGDWRAIQETLHLVSIPGMRESILEGMATAPAELSSEPGWCAGPFYSLKQAQKDVRKLASASPVLKLKAQELLELLRVDPLQQPPPCGALVGDLRGVCSRRINIQHRLIFQVLEQERIVKVLRLWSHYD